ncbi:hypothetical protein PCE1_003719 [Barthelona sp. PCE]
MRVVLIILLLTCTHGFFFYIDGKEGDDSISNCGTKTHPCKSLNIPIARCADSYSVYCSFTILRTGQYFFSEDIIMPSATLIIDGMDSDITISGSVDADKLKLINGKYKQDKKSIFANILFLETGYYDFVDIAVTDRVTAYDAICSGEIDLTGEFVNATSSTLTFFMSPITLSNTVIEADFASLNFTTHGIILRSKHMLIDATATNLIFQKFAHEHVSFTDEDQSLTINQSVISLTAINSIVSVSDILVYDSNVTLTGGNFYGETINMVNSNLTFIGVEQVLSFRYTMFSMDNCFISNISAVLVSSDEISLSDIVSQSDFSVTESGVFDIKNTYMHNIAGTASHWFCSYCVFRKTDLRGETFLGDHIQLDRGFRMSFQQLKLNWITLHGSDINKKSVLDAKVVDISSLDISDIAFATLVPVIVLEATEKMMINSSRFWLYTPSFEVRAINPIITVKNSIFRDCVSTEPIFVYNEETSDPRELLFINVQFINSDMGSGIVSDGGFISFVNCQFNSMVFDSGAFTNFVNVTMQNITFIKYVELLVAYNVTINTITVRDSNFLFLMQAPKESVIMLHMRDVTVRSLFKLNSPMIIFKSSSFERMTLRQIFETDFAVEDRITFEAYDTTFRVNISTNKSMLVGDCVSMIIRNSFFHFANYFSVPIVCARKLTLVTDGFTVTYATKQGVGIQKPAFFAHVFNMSVLSNGFSFPMINSHNIWAENATMHGIFGANTVWGGNLVSAANIDADFSVEQMLCARCILTFTGGSVTGSITSDTPGDARCAFLDSTTIPCKHKHYKRLSSVEALEFATPQFYSNINRLPFKLNGKLKYEPLVTVNGAGYASVKQERDYAWVYLPKSVMIFAGQSFIFEFASPNSKIFSVELHIPYCDPGTYYTEVTSPATYETLGVCLDCPVGMVQLSFNFSDEFCYRVNVERDGEVVEDDSLRLRYSGAHYSVESGFNVVEKPPQTISIGRCDVSRRCIGASVRAGYFGAKVGFESAIPELNGCIDGHYGSSCHKCIHSNAKQIAMFGTCRKCSGVSIFGIMLRVILYISCELIIFSSVRSALHGASDFVHIGIYFSIWTTTHCLFHNWNLLSTWVFPLFTIECFYAPLTIAFPIVLVAVKVILHIVARKRVVHAGLLFTDTLFAVVLLHVYCTSGFNFIINSVCAAVYMLFDFAVSRTFLAIIRRYYMILQQLTVLLYVRHYNPSLLMSAMVVWTAVGISLSVIISTSDSKYHVFAVSFLPVAVSLALPKRNIVLWLTLTITCETTVLMRVLRRKRTYSTNSYSFQSTEHSENDCLLQETDAVGSFTTTSSSLESGMAISLSDLPMSQIPLSIMQDLL